MAFAWQIFFDFSGYTDMARGVARMMGFHLILNFNNPYLATGLGDFGAVCRRIVQLAEERQEFRVRSRLTTADLPR